MFLALVLCSPSDSCCHAHGAHWIGGSWHPEGSVDMKALHLLYSYMVVANILINDMIANSELRMMCTSYPITILQGMWKSTKINRKPVSRATFESMPSAIQSRNNVHFNTALNRTRIPAVHPIIPVHLWLRKLIYECHYVQPCYCNKGPSFETVKFMTK